MGFLSKIKSCCCDLPDGYTHVGGGYYLSPQTSSNVPFSPPPPYTPEGFPPPARPLSYLPSPRSGTISYMPALPSRQGQQMMSYGAVAPAPTMASHHEQQVMLYNPAANAAGTRAMAIRGRQNMTPCDSMTQTSEPATQSAMAVVTRGPNGEITIQPGRTMARVPHPMPPSMALSQVPAPVGFGAPAPAPVWAVAPRAGGWKGTLLNMAL